MFRNLAHIALINTLLYFVSVESVELILNAQNKNQPLVVTYLPDSHKFFQSVPVSNDNERIQYNSSGILITACPFEQPMINNALIQTDKIETECTKALKPIIHKKVENGKVEGYSVGYWLYYFTSEKKYSERPIFITIFELYYSKKDGGSLYYTSHEKFPGSKITFVGDENSKIKSRFDIQSTSDVREIQLVPIEDFTPMPWKITTLFDINYVSADNRIIECVNELNDFLRNYINWIDISLKIYSGKRGNSWYWKAVKHMDKGLLLIVVKSDSNEFPEPCKTECVKFGLRGLKQEIPELYCCPLIEKLAMALHLIIIGPDSIIEYLRFADEIIFSEMTTPMEVTEEG